MSTSPSVNDAATTESGRDQPWAAQIDAVEDRLDTHPDGLAPDEAERRLQEHGPNRLREVERRNLWQILWNQASLILLLLVVAGGVAWTFGQPVEALAVAVVVVINTTIGFVTEWRAVRSMEALQEMEETDATVRRGGEVQRVPAETLVPGDVVELQEGDLIPADLRLAETERLQIDESPLTGESVPVSKTSDPVPPDTELAERTNMAYKGTAVARGSGQGVVVATGMDTELGAISAMVETAESSDTPLEEKLDRLGRRLVWLTLGVAVVVTGVGVVAGRDLYLMIETGIALAVAAIPEGLPIVATLALAHGMWRMARRNALVRRLSSVETLGETTLICTDKTGTLTENRMSVHALRLPEGAVELESSDDGVHFRQNGESVDPSPGDALHRALTIGVLCTDATLDAESADGAPQGDPMDRALIELGRRIGRDRETLTQDWPELRTDPFDRQTKMMATVHAAGDGVQVAVKGAPEAVLEASTQVDDGGEPRRLDDESRAAWKEANDEMAAEGLRVLAVATKSASDEDVDPYTELCFLGLVGFLDPPRADVRPVIERCQAAGIRVVMVTGDHPDTARTVAREVGIADADADGAVLRGHDIQNVSEASEDDREAMRGAVVFARVSPAQKLDLVDLHQDGGEIVAMTGDGVNDAPALRSADIGVAMGQRGTDVAREAADMVLLDDALSSVVTAVEQGRGIFDNIRKFVVYLLSGNVGEILAVAAAAVTNAPLPLLPLQILYLNLLNDVFPALALGVGPGTKRVMEHPPRDPGEDVITGTHWRLIGGYGVLIGAVVLAVFAAALQLFAMPTEQAVTVSFLTLSVSRLVHAFTMRSTDSGVFDNEIVRNPYVWVAFGICGGLLGLAVYWPLLSEVLAVQPPGPMGWLLVAAGSTATLLLGQLVVAFRQQRSD